MNPEVRYAILTCGYVILFVAWVMAHFAIRRQRKLLDRILPAVDWSKVPDPELRE